MTGCEVAFESETVNTKGVGPEFPSRWLTSSIEIVGSVSSFWIVPTAWPSAIVAWTGVSRSTVKVSSGSNLVSPLTTTCTVWLVMPGANVTVPVAAR